MIARTRIKRHLCESCGWGQFRLRKHILEGILLSICTVTVYVPKTTQIAYIYNATVLTIWKRIVKTRITILAERMQWFSLQYIYFSGGKKFNKFAPRSAIVLLLLCLLNIYYSHRGVNCVCVFIQSNVIARRALDRPQKGCDVNEQYYIYTSLYDRLMLS